MQKVIDDTVTIIAARRSYEFRTDDLRLTYLCTSPLQTLLQQRFRFQSVTITTPDATFGPVPGTIPPGLVLRTGEWLSLEQQLIPIRYIHIEQFRIVIDIPAGSEWIDPIFAALHEVIQAFAPHVGTSILGEPNRVQDVSELSVRSPVDLMAAIAPELRTIFKEDVVPHSTQQNVVFMPQISIIALPESQMLMGTPSDYSVITLAPRAGAQPGDHTFFSAASLPTDIHMQYIKRLCQAFSDTTTEH